MGWHGLGTAFKAFLREKNRSFALEYERDERERIPEQAMQEFMAEAERTQRVYLRWSEANGVLNRVHPSGPTGPTLLSWLVRVGLLIADIDPKGKGIEDEEEIVRVAFERLGEHLLATRLLGKIKPDTLTSAIESGLLSFAFSSEDAILANRGLVEALSIQIPEHSDFGYEFVDALPGDVPRSSVLHATIAALPWRDPEYMSKRTQEIAFEALTSSGLGYETFDNLLAIATLETAPDAFWLHGLLLNQTMPQRDGFLCGYLYDRVEKSSAVERLLRAPFEVETKQIPEPVLLRWATLLLWFCVAADRRVRDRATKGLVAITQPRPIIWAALIGQFSAVNDEYVVERCLCAAYGTLLRTRDAVAEQAVAEAAYKAVFADSGVFQNAMIRDYARSIIELAAQDGVLPPGVELARARPPYKSEWPLIIPSEKDVEFYKDAHDEYPKLYFSCLGDDFFTYTLLALERYTHVVSREAMGRWLLSHVVKAMGYGGEVLSSYDGHMIYRFGSGRGRPGWAERIGKKYQRIALNRLAARLADHVKPKLKEWEEEEKGIPFIFKRGRDIDPSILSAEQDDDKSATSWWFPESYDFTAADTKSDEEWVAIVDDLPSSEKLLQPLYREENKQWQLLEVYPTWSAKNYDDKEQKQYRYIWVQIRSYLVRQQSAQRMFGWLGKQHFMGRWMVDGTAYHEGFVGEYPWGALFNIYPETWQKTYRGGKKYLAPLMPVCSSVSPEYEDDSSQAQNIRLKAPAHIFFKEKQLQWDGLGGYLDDDGKLKFIDPSLSESGRSALLIEREFLLKYLCSNKLALLWTVLGEKQILGGFGDAVPRLEFSRAHLLEQDGSFRSSKPIFEVWNPKTKQKKRGGKI